LSFLIDTNVISETRKRAPDPAVVAWLRAVRPETLHVSVLTFGEIAKGAALKGARDPAAGSALRVWLGGLRAQFAGRTLGVDAAVAEEWGRLAAIRPLQVVDGLLAATASIHGLRIVTRNTRDFDGLGVLLTDPWRG
jgi:toxin FitB